MNAAHLTAKDFRTQPWKNGGGTTLELASHGAGEGFAWRLSIADVARPGPFSDYAGCERTIMLVEGRGMELAFEDGECVTLGTPYRPFVFDGGRRTTFRLLDGPVKDLNLIVDRTRWRGTCTVATGGGMSRVDFEGDWLLVYALRGATRVEADGEAWDLREGELLRIDDSPRSALAVATADADAAVAVMRIARNAGDA